MTTDQLKRLEELCEMWANPDGTAEEEMYVPVMDMLPDIINSLKFSDELFSYIDERILSAFMVQGDCQCEEDDGPCVYCACVHAEKDLISLRNNNFTPPNDSHAK